MGKILIIDDNEINRNLLGEILSLQKLEYDLCSGVIEGLTAYRENQHDLVLMDIEMPKIDGIEGLRMIRDLKKDARVFAVTANAFREQVEGYYMLGFNDVITKPYRIKEILQKVERGIGFGDSN